MKAAEFDIRFDDGEDMADQVDWSRASRPNLGSQRISIDLPDWVVEGLDHQALRLGVSRDVLLKFWIADRLG